MIWRGKCDACGRTVTWAGDDSAEPVLPNGNEKTLCLSCLCLEKSLTRSPDLEAENIKNVKP